MADRELVVEDVTSALLTIAQWHRFDLSNDTARGYALRFVATELPLEVPAGTEDG